MATLGQKPATTHVSFQKQTITGNGGTSYTLQQSVGSELDIAVFINNTRQEPTTAYTASGTTLVTTGAVNSSDNFYVIFLAKAINTTGLPLSAVNTDNISPSAVTDAKIAGMAASKLMGDQTLGGPQGPIGLDPQSEQYLTQSLRPATFPTAGIPPQYQIGAYRDVSIAIIHKSRISHRSDISVYQCQSDDQT